MKTTTKNQVIDYLQWSSQEYENRVLLSMRKWCQQYGESPSVQQQLLANAQINRWFMTEYQKCEANFLKIVEVLPNNTKQLEAHYKACTAQVMMLYPKPLLDMIHHNPAFAAIYLNHNIPFYSN